MYCVIDAKNQRVVGQHRSRKDAMRESSVLNDRAGHVAFYVQYRWWVEDER